MLGSKTPPADPPRALACVARLLQGGTVLDEDNLPPEMTHLPEACARVVFRELLQGCVNSAHSLRIIARCVLRAAASANSSFSP